jgi:hypothetical protein
MAVCTGIGLFVTNRREFKGISIQFWLDHPLDQLQAGYFRYCATFSFVTS